MQVVKLRRSHRISRAAEYPKIEDQLDAVFKFAKAVKESGINLPQDVVDWIDRCQAVKDKHPKPE